MMMDNEEIAREHQLIFDLAKSNKKRIDNLEEEQKELRNLTNAVSQMVIEQKNMRDDLAEMKGDVKQIKEKPAKRWDMAAEKVLMLVIAGIVTWMLAKIGI
ncbi:MAG: hypothetical protein IJF04_03905 [Oscillospiraceae bacterium]|nr:hypothetical protein [Oscillospiraceae bacterium]